MDKLPGYIAIEGPIGVGKTSFACKLAKDFSAHLALEEVDENPFLEKFYKNPENFALPVQLFFLTSRVRQLSSFRQTDMFNSIRISDFLMEKDRLFAELTLGEHEFNLYQQVYESLTQDLLQPDLVIYLQAPIDELINRIQKRGRSFEHLIERDYLEKISNMYSEFFYHYYASPLLIINASKVDFVQDENDYAQLVERIGTLQHGRHFFNPLPMQDKFILDEHA